MGALLLAAFLTFFIPGTITRSWVIGVVALVVVPAFYGALLLGLVGRDLGDNWELVALLVWGASLTGVATGVTIGRRLFGRVEDA